MENITEANISIEITKYPQQDRLYQLNTYRVMCWVPEPGTKRVNWVMTSSITIDKLQKEEVYFIFSLFLLQVINIWKYF